LGVVAKVVAHANFVGESMMDGKSCSMCARNFISLCHPCSSRRLRFPQRAPN